MRAHHGPNIEKKVLYAATCAGLSSGRSFYRSSDGNFAENSLWHVLTEASGISVGHHGRLPNLP